MVRVHSEVPQALCGTGQTHVGQGSCVVVMCCVSIILSQHVIFAAQGSTLRRGEATSSFIPKKNNPLQRTDTTNYTRTHHPTTLRLGYDRTDQAYTQPCTMPPKSFKDKYLRSRLTSIRLDLSLARVNIPLQS